MLDDDLDEQVGVSTERCARTHAPEVLNMHTYTHTCDARGGVVKVRDHTGKSRCGRERESERERERARERERPWLAAQERGRETHIDVCVKERERQAAGATERRIQKEIDTQVEGGGDRHTQGRKGRDKKKEAEGKWLGGGMHHDTRWRGRERASESELIQEVLHAKSDALRAERDLCMLKETCDLPNETCNLLKTYYVRGKDGGPALWGEEEEEEEEAAASDEEEGSSSNDEEEEEVCVLCQ